MDIVIKIKNVPKEQTDDIWESIKSAKLAVYSEVVPKDMPEEVEIDFSKINDEEEAFITLFGVLNLYGTYFQSN